MQAPAQSAPSKGSMSVSKGMNENHFTRSEKSKDIRSTNITAAKGFLSSS